VLTVSFGQACNSIFVLAMLPLFDRVLYPLVSRSCGTMVATHAVRSQHEHVDSLNSIHGNSFHTSLIPWPESTACVHREHGPSHLFENDCLIYASISHQIHRMAVGMLLASLSFVCAALVQRWIDSDSAASSVGGGSAGVGPAWNNTGTTPISTDEKNGEVNVLWQVKHFFFFLNRLSRFFSCV
jgi:hypothetical protein